MENTNYLTRIQKRKMNLCADMMNTKKKRIENNGSNENEHYSCEKKYDSNVDTTSSQHSKSSSNGATLEIKGTVSIPNRNKCKSTDSVLSKVDTRSRARAQIELNLNAQHNETEIENNHEKDDLNGIEHILREKKCGSNVSSSKNAKSSSNGATFQIKGTASVPNRNKCKNTDKVSIRVDTRSRTRAQIKLNSNAQVNEVENKNDHEKDNSIGNKYMLSDKKCDSNVSSSKEPKPGISTLLEINGADIIAKGKNKKDCIPATTTRPITRAACKTNSNVSNIHKYNEAVGVKRKFGAINDEESNHIPSKFSDTDNKGTFSSLIEKEDTSDPAPTIKTSSTRATTRSKKCVRNVTNFGTGKNYEQKQSSSKKNHTASSSKGCKANREIERVSSVEIGDLVWAKLSGWPYWPSTVEEIMPDGMIRVRFIEKKSRFAVLKVASIVSFEEGCFKNEIKESIKKNQTLKKCVKDAMTKMIMLDLLKS